jgi:hypothetical protein
MGREKGLFGTELVACRPVIGAKGGFRAFDPFIDGRFSYEKAIS